MKLYKTFLLVLIGLCAKSTLLGQSVEFQKQFSISVQKEKISNVLEMIQLETRYKFVYKSEILPEDKLITVTAKNTTIEQFLPPLLASVNLEMSFYKDYIIIKKSTEAKELELISSEFNDKELGHVETYKFKDTIKTVVRDTIYKVLYDSLDISIYNTDIINQRIIFSIHNNPILWQPKFGLEFSYGQQLPGEYKINIEEPDVNINLDEIYKNLQNRYIASSNLTGFIKFKFIKIETGVSVLHSRYSINTSSLTKELSVVDSVLDQVSISVHNGILYTYTYDTSTINLDIRPNELDISNSFTYVGIPFYVACEFSKGKMLYFGSIGITKYFLIHSKGIELRLADTEIANMNNWENLEKSFITSAIKAGVGYNISPHICITLASKIYFSDRSGLDLSYRDYYRDNLAFSLGFQYQFSKYKVY